MNPPIDPRRMNRRSLLQGTAAFGLTASISGCRPARTSEAAESNRNEQRPVAADSGYRLFFVEPAEGEFFTNVEELKPRPNMISWHQGRLLHETESPPSHPPYSYVVWSKPEDAKTLEAVPSVKSVTQVKPEAVIEFGKPASASGTLAVKLFPNVISEQYVEVPFDSVDDVVVSWRKALGDIEGVVIKAGPRPKERQLGVVTEQGQIVIEFEGKLDNKVLAVVKSHPQTIAIRWGKLFTYYFCPPCGMG